jgi:hypothetical protein
MQFRVMSPTGSSPESSSLWPALVRLGWRSEFREREGTAAMVMGGITSLSLWVWSRAFTCTLPGASADQSCSAYSRCDQDDMTCFIHSTYTFK